jgi:hypothetical protein
LGRFWDAFFLLWGVFDLVFGSFFVSVFVPSLRVGGFCGHKFSAVTNFRSQIIENFRLVFFLAAAGKKQQKKTDASNTFFSFSLETKVLHTKKQRADHTNRRRLIKRNPHHQ